MFKGLITIVAISLALLLFGNKSLGLLVFFIGSFCVILISAYNTSQREKRKSREFEYQRQATEYQNTMLQNNLEKVNQVKLEMSYQEVVEKFGGDGLLISEGANQKTMVWYMDDTNSHSVSITFTNDLVSGKELKGF